MDGIDELLARFEGEFYRRDTAPPDYEEIAALASAGAPRNMLPGWIPRSVLASDEVLARLSAKGLVTRLYSIRGGEIYEERPGDTEIPPGGKLCGGWMTLRGQDVIDAIPL